MTSWFAPRGTGLAERAYMHIKTLLMEGRHVSGEWLPIETIASELGMSRQPVMDAIKRLSSEGFIEIVPQVGSRVRRYDANEISDFYQLFANCEGLVAELAAARATPTDITRLRLLSHQISELFKLPGDEAEQNRLYRVLNRQLHAELRRITGSPAMCELVEMLGDRSDFYIAGASEPVFSAGLVEAHSEHERLIHAIEAGDEKLARAMMEAHIRGTARRLAQRLAPASEDPATSGTR